MGVQGLGPDEARAREPELFAQADRIVAMYRFDTEQDRERAHEVARIGLFRTPDFPVKKIEPTDAQIEMARTVLIDAIAVDRPHNAAQYRVDYRSGIYACEEEAIRAMFAFADVKQSTDPISYEDRVEYESRVLTEEIKIVRLMRAVKALTKVARDLREHRESPSYTEDLDDRYINDLLNAEANLDTETRAINRETGQYYYIRPESPDNQ